MQASSDGSPPFVEFNCHSVQRKTRVLKLTSSFHCKIILSSLQFGQPLFYLAWCGWLVISKEVLRDRPQARAGNTMSEYILAPWGVECLQLAIVQTVFGKVLIILIICNGKSYHQNDIIAWILMIFQGTLSVQSWSVENETEDENNSNNHANGSCLDMIGDSMVRRQCNRGAPARPDPFVAQHVAHLHI